MMAFFIVMWILASSEEVKEAVSDYFNAPENYSVFTGKRTALIELSDIPAPPAKGDSDYDGGDSKSSNQSSLFLSFSDSKKENVDGVVAVIDEQTAKAIRDSISAEKQVQEVAENIKIEIEEMLKGTTSLDFRNILSSINIEITNEGLRIELLESHDNNFFEVGSARLKPDAQIILKQLSKQIGRLGNYVEIEGHTDSRGYSKSNAYSN